MGCASMDRIYLTSVTVNICTWFAQLDTRIPLGIFDMICMAGFGLGTGNDATAMRIETLEPPKIHVRPLPVTEETGRSLLGFKVWQ